MDTKIERDRETETKTDREKERERDKKQIERKRERDIDRERECDNVRCGGKKPATIMSPSSLYLLSIGGRIVSKWGIR